MQSFESAGIDKNPNLVCYNPLFRHDNTEMSRINIHYAILYRVPPHWGDVHQNAVIFNMFSGVAVF